MKKIRAFLLVGLLASGVVCSSRAELDINGKIQVIPIPERSHAVINFSGSSAHDVDMVALDDAGNAAYAAPEPRSTPGNVESNTLQNSLRNQAPDNFVPLRYVTVEEEGVVEFYYSAGVTANGALYFSLSSYGNAEELCGMRSARVIAGIPDYLRLPPPFVRDLPHTGLELEISGANESGYWGAGGGATDSSYSAYGGFFFTYTGGLYTIFDGTFKSLYQYEPWLGSRVASSGSLQVVSANFAPNRANANGWSLGNTVAGYWYRRGVDGGATSPLLWNGQEIIPLPGYGIALNNSNDVLIAASDPGNDMAAILERGISRNRRPFREAGSTLGLIPLPLQAQIRNVQSLLLSNRRTIAGSNIQPVLHIVFAAETLRDAGTDTWERTVFLLRILSNNTTDLYELPGIQNLHLRAINKNGLLAAIGTPADQIAKQALLLVPVDIAVDSNRDGVIKFAGNFNDSAVAGKPTDKTTQDKPFRFWINDDDDSGEQDHPGSSTKDSASNTIVSLRDLEDFTRLYLHIGGLQDAIAVGTITVGLEWRNTTDTPSVKVFQAAEVDGGAQYLKTDVAAGNQKTGTFGTALGTVSNGGSFKLPTSFWQADALTGKPALSKDNPNRHLIFEGVGEGKGQLVMTFWKGSTRMGEGGGVWLDIKNVKKMYQRMDSATAHPWENVAFEAEPNEDQKEAVVFVHGWRMSPEGAGNFAETMYKRMWHRGFKGRFVAFHWDTWWHDGASWVPWAGEAIDAYLARYNDSEYTAWQGAAASLKTFVDSLPFQRKSVVAHSMGNIVAGEALRQGMKAKNYAMLNAAVPAACYDEDELRIKQKTQYVQSAGLLFFNMWDSPTPDSDADLATRKLAYRGALKNIGRNANVINFYLPDDQATSFAWEINNDQTKPPLYQGEQGNAVFDFNFEYDPNGQPAKKLWKFAISALYPSYYITDKPEAMAYACRTWGKAAGAWGSTQGAVNSGAVNMKDTDFGSPRGFDTEHSAEFNRRIQQLKPFYDQLLQSLDINFNNQ